MSTKAAKGKTKHYGIPNFYDAASGIKAFFDINGYLHLCNVPVMKCGKLQQTISSVEGHDGCQLKTISDYERERGWVYAFRPEEEVFSRKTMDSFLGIPLIMHGRNGPYINTTARKIFFLPYCNEPDGNHPIGTVTAVRRGKGKTKDFLLVDIKVWNVHYLAKSVKSGECKAITCGTLLYNKCMNSADSEVKIKQERMRANCLFLTWGDVFGMDIFEQKTKLYKWFVKNVIEGFGSVGEMSKIPQKKFKGNAKKR